MSEYADFEIGRELWDWRTGERRVFWRPFVIEELRQQGDYVMVSPALGNGVLLRVTTYHPDGGEIQVGPGTHRAMLYGAIPRYWGKK